MLLYALHQNWLILSTLFCPIYSENSNRVPSILSLGSETPSLLRAMLHFYLHGKFLFEFIKVFIYEYTEKTKPRVIMTANQKKGVYHIEPMKTQWKGEQSVSFAFDWEYIWCEFS